jgi:hypothetical protein
MSYPDYWASELSLVSKLVPDIGQEQLPDLMPGLYKVEETVEDFRPPPPPVVQVKAPPRPSRKCTKRQFQKKRPNGMGHRVCPHGKDKYYCVVCFPHLTCECEKKMVIYYCKNPKCIEAHQARREARKEGFMSKRAEKERLACEKKAQSKMAKS